MSTLLDFKKVKLLKNQEKQMFSKKFWEVVKFKNG